MKTTPIHVMEVELHLTPLEIRRHYLAGKFNLKTKSMNNNPVNMAINQLHSIQDGSYWRYKKTPLLITSHNQLKDVPIHSSTQLEMFTLNPWVQNIDTFYIEKTLYILLNLLKKPSETIIGPN